MKAEQILPIEIIELIQKYVDGQYIYIPRKENARREWGEKTKIRKELKERDQKIYTDFQLGYSVSNLATMYYLSEKSIQRIIQKIKNSA
jgi:Mor family transcriptional regulator